MDVLDFCNRILGEQAEELNAQECYALIMACYLHDIGMGISEKDYRSFCEQPEMSLLRAEYPEGDDVQFIRDYHEEFSGLLIRKYAEVFEIPDELESAGYSKATKALLDSSKLQTELGWRPQFDIKTAVAHTITILRDLRNGEDQVC
jgi:hypothetical protein